MRHLAFAVSMVGEILLLLMLGVAGIAFAAALLVIVPIPAFVIFVGMGVLSSIDELLNPRPRGPGKRG